MPELLQEGYDVFVVRAGYGRPIIGHPKAKCEPGFVIKVVRWQTRKGRKINLGVRMYYNNGQGEPTRRGSVPFMTEGAARKAAKTVKLDW